jgi:predicted AlkP superfamily pyrophosphatase or phosphodiesterase
VSPAAGQQLPGRDRLTIVFVLDGLRPDLITPEDTPVLHRLRTEGVNFTNTHASFPTVTRVNGPAISTGTYPGTNGLVSNSMYVPAVNPTGQFSTGEIENLFTLDEVTGGRLLFVKGLGERLHERGQLVAAVSSGTTGSALLLNHRAPQGIGVLINGYFNPGVLAAYPAHVNTAVLSRFGPPPVKVAPALAAVDWHEEVLREYVIPELRPSVVLNWITEPDGSHHSFGVGSPQAMLSIRNDDRNIGLILDKLETLGLLDETNIFVVSDHGFGVTVFGVNVNQELINAGLKASATSTDVVTASSSQTMLLHVKDRDPQAIRRIVRFLQAQPWIGAIFTHAKEPGRKADRRRHDGKKQDKRVDPYGFVEGTFSLELIHNANDERGADIVFTFPWTSEKNAFGYPGTDYSAGGGVTGPRTGNASDHGSMSPWTVRNTFLAWGVDFKQGATVRVPVGNVDIVPTILALKGIPGDETLDGRVLREALKGGPDEEKVEMETKTYRTQTRRGSYKAVIQVTEVGHRRYIDKSWRVTP